MKTKNSKVDLEKLEIGMQYQGGIIFYLLKEGDTGYDPKVIHGLIASTEDQGASAEYKFPAIVWSLTKDESELVLSGTMTTIGSGLANTDLIIAQYGAGDYVCTYAAKVARDFRGDGYTDWYLPSKDELNELFKSRNKVGGFTYTEDWRGPVGTWPDVDFWSSSEYDSYSAWLQDFDTGWLHGEDKCFWHGLVRAIRAF